MLLSPQIFLGILQEIQGGVGWILVGLEVLQVH